MKIYLFLILMAFLGVCNAFSQTLTTYEYDELNRLVKVDYPNGQRVEYEYDALGNRISRTVTQVGYAISVQVTPEGSGAVEGAGVVGIGATCTLTAMPELGFCFSNWTEDGEVVSTDNPYAFTVTGPRSLVAIFEVCPVTQTSQLAAGWNWISTYVEMGGVNGLDMLKESLDANGLYIQNGLLYTESWEEDGETFWYGSLDEVPMTNETMYMVQVAADCTVTLTGELADPAAHPITINPGWNWIGFPCNQTMSIEDAFANFPVADGDAIMHGISYSDAFLYGDEVIWYGSITQLEPGQGFMYYSNDTQPKTLIYSTTSKGKSVFLGKRKE